jgi:hypothetical protein
MQLANGTIRSIITLPFPAYDSPHCSKEDAMAHTNRGRVILGGLVAGLVINVVEYITNGVVLRDAWGTAFRKRVA